MVAACDETEPDRAPVDTGAAGDGNGANGGLPECEASSEEMVCVPAGVFWMGCSQSIEDGCQPFEFPFHEVYLDAFEVDRYEVTVASYRSCADAGECTSPGECDDGGSDLDDAPVRCVDWQQASDYCAWAGKRLLTEAEWEKAARGDDDPRIYPWGDDPPTCERTVFDEDGPGCSEEGPLAVGSRPPGNSPYGVTDMAGNVEEWVIDWFLSDSYSVPDRQNPTGPDQGSHRIVRGGSYLSSAISLRVSGRWGYPPNAQSARRGFRCGRSIE